MAGRAKPCALERTGPVCSPQSVGTYGQRLASSLALTMCNDTPMGRCLRRCIMHRGFARLARHVIERTP